MAADSTIAIDLELRKEQAEKRLRAFTDDAAKQLERLQKVQAKYDATPTAFVRNQLMASQGAYERRLGAAKGAAKDVENLQLKIDQEEARKGGRLFGIAVNKQTEKFAKQFVGMYLGRELMNLGFAAMMPVGQSTYDVRKAQEASEGALGGMAIGAMFGPIGAAAGALTGALIGLTGSMIKLNKEIEQNQLGRMFDTINQRLQSGRSIQNAAFERTLQYHMRPTRIAMLNQRLQEVQSGKGEYSIKNLERALKSFEERKDIESPEYKQLQELMSRARSEQSSLQRQLFEEATQPLYRQVDPKSLTDQYAKQGLYSGMARQGTFATGEETPIAGIDFQKLNNPVVTELQRIRGVLEKVASQGDVNVKGEMSQRVATQALSTFGIGS